MVYICRNYSLLDVLKMSGIVTHSKSDSISVRKSSHDSDSDDYAEIDDIQACQKHEEMEVKGKNQMTDLHILHQEVQNPSFTAKDSNCTCENCKASSFKYCLMLILGVILTAVLVFISLILIKISALELSNKLQDLSSLNQSHVLFNNAAQNLYERNEAFFSDFQPTAVNISRSFSNLLYEFQDALTTIKEEKISRNDYIFNPTSCADILYHNSSSSSGYYLVRSSTGQLTSVYCDMTRTCGNITGGWMRVAELDLDHCPTGLKSRYFEGIRTCVVNEDAPGCTSVFFSSFSIFYSKVCGQVSGYGVGTIDGIFFNRHQRGSSITDNYLDGISITSSTSHVWSFVAGDCECSYTLPFFNNDWTCDGNGCAIGDFCNELLWNSSLCGERTPFLKRLSVSSTADIEMRVCRDEPRDNEDIAVSSIELYVH